MFFWVFLPKPTKLPPQFVFFWNGKPKRTKLSRGYQMDKQTAKQRKTDEIGFHDGGRCKDASCTPCKPLRESIQIDIVLLLVLINQGWRRYVHTGTMCQPLAIGALAWNIFQALALRQGQWNGSCHRWRIKAGNLPSYAGSSFEVAKVLQ